MKKMRVWKTVLTMVLVAGLMLTNYQMVLAEDTGNEYWLGRSGPSILTLQEGTVLRAGDTLNWTTTPSLDVSVYINDSLVQNGWTADTDYRVTALRDELNTSSVTYHASYYITLEEIVSPTTATVVLEEPAWVLNWKSDYAEMQRRIKEAQADDVVAIDARIWHSFNKEQLGTLMERKDITLVFYYDFNGEQFSVTIPAGTEIELDCDWYGPLKMASMFGREMLEEINL